MGRKIILIICLAICILGISFSVYGEGETNLFGNGGFEQQDSGGIFPSWTAENGATGVQSVFAAATNKVKSGQYALMIKADTANDAHMSQVVYVKPNTFYRFSGWIATENVPMTATGAHLSIMGTWDHTTPIIGTADWTYSEICFRTNDSQTQINLTARLGMWGSVNTGTAYFDDLSLVELTTPPVSYVSIAPPPGQSAGDTNTISQNQSQKGLGTWGLVILCGILLLFLNFIFYRLSKRVPLPVSENITEETEPMKPYTIWERLYRSFIKIPGESLELEVEPVNENSLWQKLMQVRIGRFQFDSRYLILALILIIGCFVRLYNLENNMPGLNQDEASVGYDAFALANYGIDRNDMHFPIHFISWGSGQNSLYAAIIMPFIKIFGLSATTTRIGSALFGILALLLLFLVVKFIANWELALFSTFILAITPWGIISSRSGVENNIFPVIILLGVYLYLLALRNKRYLTITSVVFALSLYSYGTSYFVIPLFMLALAVCYFFYVEDNRIHKLDYAHNMIKNAIVFAIISIPIGIFLLINFSPIFPSSINLPFLSIPKLTTPGARFGQVTFLNQGVGFSQMVSQTVKYFGYYVDTVFKQGGSIFFVADRYGEIFNISIFFFAIGFIIALIECWKGIRKKKLTLETIFIIWFLLSTLLGIVFETNPGRINIIFIPMIFFVAYGIYKPIHGVATFAAFFFKGKQRLAQNSIKTVLYILIILVYLSQFLGFNNFFNRYWPDQAGMYAMESFKDAYAFASSIKEPAQKMVIIPQDYIESYIYVLFYAKYDPHKFVETVKYVDPNADFRVVESFGDYKFVSVNSAFTPEPNTVYIVFNDKLAFAQGNARTTRQFKRFTVAVF